MREIIGVYEALPRPMYFGPRGHLGHRLPAVSVGDVGLSAEISWDSMSAQYRRTVAQRHPSTCTVSVLQAVWHLRGDEFWALGDVQRTPYCPMNQALKLPRDLSILQVLGAMPIGNRLLEQICRQRAANPPPRAGTGPKPQKFLSRNGVELLGNRNWGTFKLCGTAAPRSFNLSLWSVAYLDWCHTLPFEPLSPRNTCCTCSTVLFAAQVI